MATNGTIIYNYPQIKEIIENDPNSKENAFYLNPCLTFSELINRKPINAFELSRHPSNNAINFLINNPSFIDMRGLAENTNHKIGPLLEKYKDQIDKYTEDRLSESCNPVIMNFLEKHPHHIHWYKLCANKCEQAIRLIEQNIDKIIWRPFSSNSSAMHILLENIDKIDWIGLCLNTHPKAIEMLENKINENPDQIMLFFLSENPNAINIMINHPELFNINNFMRNSNGFSYIEKQMDNDIHLKTIKSNLSNLIYNSNNIQIINKMWKLKIISKERIVSLINYTLCISRAVFDLDYQQMSKMRSKILYPELIANVFHPDKMEKRIDHYLQNGGKFSNFDFNL